jgi:hypothetical protein
MTSVLATLAVLVLIIGVVSIGYVVSRRKSTVLREGGPDRVTEDVVSGLMGELRKWQAEAAYWKNTAERLQREIDRR